MPILQEKSDMSSFCKHTIRDIRIGNDLAIRWSILTNGEAKSLEGRDLTLTLWHPHGKRVLTDFTVRDNTLTWVFPGRDQRYTGEYILTLSENRGEPGMATVDQQGFRLVARMFGTNGLSEPEELELTTADMAVAAGMYDLATEESDGLMPKEDKALVNRCRDDLEALTDEIIEGWFYSEDSEESEGPEDPEVSEDP